MESSVKQAANELLSRRVSGMKAPRLDEQVRPNNVEDSLQIQASMIELHSSQVGGWKCLLPLSEDKLIVAPIFADSVQQGMECMAFSDNDAVRIEPEIAFILGSDLPANAQGYSEAQINDAIGSCHMALELIQDRFVEGSGAEFYEVLADCLVNQGLFIGPEIEREKAFLATAIDITISQVPVSSQLPASSQVAIASQITASKSEQVQSFAGSHPNSLPQAPLYWLINYMTRRGVSFSAGEAIITGSYCGVVEVEFDKPTSVCYDGLGEYQVTFKQKV